MPDLKSKEHVMRSSALLLAVCLIPAAARGQVPLRYPETRTVDHVDTYHGAKVADPYRWLEQDVRKSDDVKSWVAAENAVTFGYLNGLPERDAIRRRLTELWNYEKYSVPFKAGGKYFFSKNDGLQNQAIVYTMDRLRGEPRKLLDPNTWSSDGTVALSGIIPTDDGRYLAYGVAEAGSDWQHWKVVEVASGKDLPDEIKWIKYGRVTWTKDGKGFFYGRYPEPRPGEQFRGLTFNMSIYYHPLGVPQNEDILVYKRPDHPDWGFSTEVTEDGRYLILTVHKGTDARFRVTYRDLSRPLEMPIDLVEDFDNEYSFIANDGPVFYFKTDYQAPRGRILAIDLRKPERTNWKEIVAQSNDSLRTVNMVANMFVADYLQDAKSLIKVFAPDGSLVRKLDLPGIGAASGFAGKRTDTETFYSFSSFATPPTIFHYDLISAKSDVYRKPNVKFDPDKYEVKQVKYRSKDGTVVPMFITAKKDARLYGSSPTLLYGYGGFDIPMTPRFSVAWLEWLDMGGILAVANLRGGGEYGQDWHKAGTKLHKQNVFDDFIAAAEWLIKNRYTRPDKIAIEGRSNGGLLVGAVLTQRPDLFGACLPGVGVMDMLRFQKFTAGRFWVDDYGSSDNPEEFKALYAYSPYHNIKDGTKYPATLVTTADTDDRVVPGHSFKFAARLQHAQAGPAPVLIRIETKAGHGAGKPTAKQIEEVADEWAFLVKNLGMKVESN
jgi:prolyl oligopeptidase